MASSFNSVAPRSVSNRAAFVNVFMIVGADDAPLLFVDLSSDGIRDDSPHLDEFIIHSSLDAVDALLLHTPDSFLRTVDKFNDFNVTAFAGAGDVKMAMLHKITHEESIRLFFQDIYHMLVKVLANPFYVRGVRINDPFFEKAVREVARQRLVPIGSQY